MRISLFAVGKVKSGPESDLIQRYIDRVSKTGPAIGLEFMKIIEINESKASSAKERKKNEAMQLKKNISNHTKLILLDEKGDHLTSEQFTSIIRKLRDNGERDITFAIGGADGHDQDLRHKAYKTISLGQMTWPHQMVRILLSEQLYRCVTILSGHPYHRF